MTTKPSPTTKMDRATRSIVKEEGLFALWKGHVPAQLLSVVYGLTQFMTFEMLTQEVWHLVPFLRHDTYKPVVHFLCGGIAGSLATILSFPSDVVRTRLVAQGEPKVYKNLPQAISMIYRIEGPRAFFKGLSPTIVQVTPHAGVQFSAYSIFTMQLKGTDAQYIPISGVGSLVCGSLSGICAKTAVYPFDLARKRLQIQGFQHARKGFGKPFICHGLIECLVTTIREEKMIGLFKGLWPSLLKAAVTTALHFYIYEQTCHAIAATHR
ncbi:Mitochondrial thiamine pyrophosphate carrier [Blattella germanica]|nr:Mitochondrial thiamine pyrophosphate carrier [Blattella germanica]